MQFRTIVPLGLLLGIHTATAARAQQAEAPVAENPRDRARALANEGAALFDEGKYQEAVQKFLEAERYFSAPTLRLMIARSYDRLGRLLEARDVYRMIVAQALPDDAPPEFLQARQTAGAEIHALAARIPTLRVLVNGAGASGLILTVDGKTIPVQPTEARAPARSAAPPQLGTSPLSQNPGSHTVVVSALDYASVTKVVPLEEGARTEIVVDLLPAIAEIFTAPLRLPQGPVNPAVQQDAPAASSGPSLAPVFVGVAVGVTLWSIGVGTASLANRQAAERDEVCSGARCPTRGAQYRWAALETDRAALSNTSAWSFLGAGLVGVATAGYALWPRPAPDGSRSASPRVVVRGSQVVMTGSW